MRELTDTEIIESVRKGNQSDFEILVDRYKNKAFSLLCNMLKDTMEAEEVLQDAFLKAFYGLKNFKNEAKFSTWFYRIVYNTALTRLSAKKRKIEKEMTSIDDELNIADDYYTNQSEKKELGKFLNEIINKLPSNYASVITMFYLEEMSCEEISEVTNQSISNVKVLLYRSRNALREIVLKNNYTMELL
jgi:RNA polymerase sigma-70 factor (ECF subfamily)